MIDSNQPSDTPRYKIGVLTSSRADYGIYKPLLRLMKEDEQIEVSLIVFGLHLMPQYGLTLRLIEEDDYGDIYKVGGMPESDDLLSISMGYGEMLKQFSLFWSKNLFDFVLCLGDRFEMSAAVQASIPFEVPLAHLHGGETTLGATDNIYRHQISLASKLHFVAAEAFKTRVIELTDGSNNVHCVGALSLDNIHELMLPPWEKVCEEFLIPNKPFILITFHPETVSPERNKLYAQETEIALCELSKEWHLVITLPNADTEGSVFREMLNRLYSEIPEKVHLVDNFGKEKYFAAMKASEILLGNTSSGILEAASFGKYVVNIGDRQKGRLQSGNILNSTFDANQIIKNAYQATELGRYTGDNVYHQENTATKILKILKSAES